jgi:hypothetical protein
VREKRERDRNTKGRKKDGEGLRYEETNSSPLNFNGILH